MELSLKQKPFVEIKNLEKVYLNGAKAVYNFNLNIAKNEFVVIVGPSGCGKSTTLRMIAGLEDITNGELYIDNEFANYKPSKDRKIAIVFQSYALYSQMTVFENIAFPLTVTKYPFPVVHKKLLSLNETLNVLENNDLNKIITLLRTSKNTKITKLEDFRYVSKKLSISLEGAKKLLSLNLIDTNNENVNNIIDSIKEEILAEEQLLTKENKKINENYEYLDENNNVIIEERKMTKYEVEDKVFHVAKILDLGLYLNRIPKELSGGQMQRVALGRAIVKNVPLFLMDEPLSNLDAKLRLTMRSEIVKLHKKTNATTIYVTHDQTEAMTMADRIVVMSKGFVQQIDSPKNIYNNPKNLFVAKFVGTPPMNILTGEFDGTKINVCDGLEILLDEDKKNLIQSFYKNKYLEFETAYKNYDGSDKSKEFILKVLSALDDTRAMVQQKSKQKGGFTTLFEKMKQIFNKEEKKEIDNELVALENKMNQLKEYSENNHPLILGIRPEKVCIEIAKENIEYKNAYILKPTVVELLGNEFHVHFDFSNIDMIAKIDTKEDVTTDTSLVLTLSIDDMFVFDPITGERIY